MILSTAFQIVSKQILVHFIYFPKILHAMKKCCKMFLEKLSQQGDNERLHTDDIYLWKRKNYFF